MSSDRSTKADAAHWALWLLGGTVGTLVGLGLADAYGSDNPGSAIVRTLSGLAILIALIGFIGLLVRIARSG